MTTDQAGKKSVIVNDLLENCAAGLRIQGQVIRVIFQHRPNLLEGDVVFVNRLAYNLKIPLTDVVLARTGEPRRGDIVTFSSPRDGTRLIKRIVALPGDVVEMRDEVLLIDGRTASYSNPSLVVEPRQHGDTQALRVTESIGRDRRRVQLLAGVSALSSFGQVRVPDDMYLMLGDNRDDSADSRYFGFVPRRLLIGHAERVLVSADILGNWQPRFARFWRRLQ